MLGTAGPDRGVRPRGGLRRAADHLLGGHRADQVRRQGRLAGGQAGRAGRGDAGRASRRSCTRCRSRRCGASARRRPRSCTGWGCSRSATSPTPRAAPCAARSGRTPARVLSELAWGRDPRRVVPQVPERSVGSQETFAADSDRPEVVKRELLRMADRTASRMRKQGVLGRTVHDLGAVRRLLRAHPVGDDAHPHRCHRRRSTPRRSGCTTGSGSTGRGSAGSGSGCEQLVDVHSRLPPAPAHRSRARLAGGRPGRRCGGVASSARRRCSGLRPDPARPSASRSDWVSLRLGHLD